MSPKKKPAAKWTKNCKAYKTLKEGLLDGTIDSTMKPKEVHESNNAFLKYPLASFHSAFNRMKAELGVHVRDDGKLQ
jgi:DnaJ-domain-containing protein 1